MDETSKNAFKWCALLMAVTIASAIGYWLYMVRERNVEIDIGLYGPRVSAQNNNEDDYQKIPKYTVSCNRKGTIHQMEMFSLIPESEELLKTSFSGSDERRSMGYTVGEKTWYYQDVFIQILKEINGEWQSLYTYDLDDCSQEGLFNLGIVRRQGDQGSAVEVGNQLDFQLVRFVDRFNQQHDFLITEYTILNPAGLSVQTDTQIFDLEDPASTSDRQKMAILGRLEDTLNDPNDDIGVYKILQGSGNTGPYALSRLFEYNAVTGRYEIQQTVKQAWLAEMDTLIQQAASE